MRVYALTVTCRRGGTAEHTSERWTQEFASDQEARDAAAYSVAWIKITEDYNEASWKLVTEDGRVVEEGR